MKWLLSKNHNNRSNWNANGLFYTRVKRWGLLWTDIMDVEDVAKGFAINLGSILMAVGSLGGLVVGNLVAVGAAGQ